MDFQIIKELIDSKGITTNTLAKAIDMTHTGLTKAIENGSLKVDTLEKIAAFFKMSPREFFDSEEQQSQESKFNYLKNTVLTNDEIYIELDDLLEKILRSLEPPKNLLSLIEKTIPKIELDNLLMNSAMTDMDEVKKGDYNKIQYTMQFISKYAQENNPNNTYNKLLYNIYKESFNAFTTVIDIFIKDPRITFLREENLSPEKEITTTIYNFLYRTFEFEGIKTDEIIEYLLKYFKEEDLSYNFRSSYRFRMSFNRFKGRVFPSGFPEMPKTNK
jgi:transcriptional regulator with XRE-family HTH domain